MDKRKLSERDICTKFITPALQQAGWDIQTQVRGEVSFTGGRIMMRGCVHHFGPLHRTGYAQYCQSSQPIATRRAPIRRP